MAIPKPGQVCWYNFLKVIFSVSSRFVNRVGKTQFWWWNKTVRLSWGFHWSRVWAITAGKAGSLEEKKIFKRDESPRSLGWKFTFLSSYRPLVHLKTSFSFFPHNSHLSIDIFSWQSQSLKSFSSLPVHNALCDLLAPLVLAPCRQQAKACLRHSFLSGTWKGHRFLPIIYFSSGLRGLTLSSDALAVHSDCTSG